MPRFLLGAATLTACVIAATALSYAQTGPADRAATGTEEVVIVAQKRREPLKCAPVSASVVGTAQLAAVNASTLADLNKIVPS